VPHDFEESPASPSAKPPPYTRNPPYIRDPPHYASTEAEVSNPVSLKKDSRVPATAKKPKEKKSKDLKTAGNIIPQKVKPFSNVFKRLSF